MKFTQARPYFLCFAPIDLKDAVIRVRDGYDNGVNTPITTDIEPIDEDTIALSDMNSIVPLGVIVKFGSDDTEYLVLTSTPGAGVDAIFSLGLGGATGGTFTLTFQGSTTNPIAYDASNTLIQLELEALDTIGNGDVDVTAASDFDITFQDDLGSTAITVSEFTLNGGSLIGATGEDLTLSTPGSSATDTVEITISPALVVATTASGSVTFGGRVLEVRIGEGNLTYVETVERQYIKNRGLLDTVRDGDETPMDVNFDFMWESITGITSSGIPTIEDVLKQRGEASDWITTADDPCEPYAVDLELFHDPACGGTNTELLIFANFRHESLDHNASEATIACTGKCNVTEASATRGT